MFYAPKFKTRPIFFRCKWLQELWVLLKAHSVSCNFHTKCKPSPNTMLHQASWPFLLLGALFGLLFLSTQTAAERRVHFSLNATTVTVGSTVILSCNISEFAYLDGVFNVNFFRDSFTNFERYFFAYEVSSKLYFWVG